MCEEVRQPAIQVPRAIVGGVMLNMFAGLAFLLPIAFVLPDIPMLASIPSGQPVPTIMLSATGSSVGAFCLLIPLLVLGLICGIGCVTATSRCTWAFARDGAIPGSGWWKKVDERLGIPLNAMFLGMVIEILLGLIYFGSSAAFNAFSGVGVIFLTLSYACPVTVSLLLRKRLDVMQGRFNLGSLGVFCNIVCICKKFPSLSRPRYLIICSSRLVSCRCPSLFNANISRGYERYHELCLGGFCGICFCLGHLVSNMGPKKLYRTCSRHL
jgi:amino acid transporter